MWTWALTIKTKLKTLLYYEHDGILSVSNSRTSPLKAFSNSGRITFFSSDISFSLDISLTIFFNDALWLLNVYQTECRNVFFQVFNSLNSIIPFMLVALETIRKACKLKKSLPRRRHNFSTHKITVWSISGNHSSVISLMT